MYGETYKVGDLIVFADDGDVGIILSTSKDKFEGRVYWTKEKKILNSIFEIWKIRKLTNEI